MKRFLAAACLAALVPSALAEEPPPMKRLAEERMKETVSLPPRLMLATEVLREIHLQTGWKYAYPTGALVRQIDATPFAKDAKIDDVVKLLAAKVTKKNGVIHLEADLSGAEVKRLTTALKSGKPDEQRAAAYLLGCSRSTAGIVALAAALRDTDTPNEGLRHHALRSLYRLERDFRTFLPAGRVSVFQGAGFADEFDRCRALCAVLRAEDVVPVSNEWIWAAELAGHALDPALLYVPKEKLDESRRSGYALTRDATAWTLGRLADQEAKKTPAPAAGDLRDAESAAKLVAALDSKEIAARVQAIRMIARRNDIGPDKLLDALKSAREPDLRAEILLALGRKGGADTWTAIIKELGNPDPFVRRAAIRALDRCPDPKAVDALMPILTGQNVDGYDRTLAAMSLGMIGGKDVVKRLSEHVEKTAQPISTAAMALGWTGDPAAIPALIKCTKIESDSLKGYAFTALARFGTKEACEALAATYGQADNIARYQGHAAIRLAGAQSQEAVDHYVGTLKTGRGKIAAHGLEMAEDPRAVDVLVEQFPKSTGQRAFWMLQALGRIGDPKAVPTLIAALDNESEFIRYEALRALRWRWFWNRADVQAAVKKHPAFKAFVEPAPSLEEQKPNTWVLRHWAIDMDDYRHANTTYEAGMVFDESSGKAVKWGAHGQRCDAPQLAETWLYDPAKNEWAYTKSPVEPYGMCGTWGLAYDRANRCVVSVQETGCNHGWQWVWGRATRVSVPWVYYGDKDRWAPVRTTVNPGPRGFTAMTYDDKSQVVLLYGGQGGDKKTAENVWAYDAYMNTWTCMPADASSPGYRTNFGFVYLPEKDRVLTTGGVYGKSDNRTLLYDLAANKWEDAKAKGNPPKFNQPVKYDPASKTVLAWQIGSEHAPAVWQYSPDANEWKRLAAAPEPTPHYESVDMCYDLIHNIFILDGGHLNWETDHIGVREVWTYKATAGGAAAKPNPAPATLHKEPRFPIDTAASVRPDRSVEVEWSKSDSPDVAGYNVYAATMKAGKDVHPSSMTQFTEFVRLTEKPVTETAFVDKRELKAADGLFNHEVRGYQVRAVNAAGVESGPSALALTLTSSVPSVTATERPDGSTFIEWKPVPEKNILGYAVYRMDEYRHTACVRLNAAPVTGTAYVDWPEVPKAERRRYYVVAVDALNQEGLPSTGAWAFGRP